MIVAEMASMKIPTCAFGALKATLLSGWYFLVLPFYQERVVKMEKEGERMSTEKKERGIIRVGGPIGSGCSPWVAGYYPYSISWLQHSEYSWMHGPVRYYDNARLSMQRIDLSSYCCALPDVATYSSPALQWPSQPYHWWYSPHGHHNHQGN